MDCDSCKKNGTPEERNVGPVDQYYHEGMMVRMERAQKRLWILCIILIALLFGSWVGFFVYESQFEDQVITQEVSQSADGTGSNSYSGNVVGGDYNGNAEDQDNN